MVLPKSASHDFSKEFGIKRLSRDSKAISEAKQREITIKPPADLISKLFLSKSQFHEKSFKKTIIEDFKEIAVGDKRIGITQLEVIGLKREKRTSS